MFLLFIFFIQPFFQEECGDIFKFLIVYFNHAYLYIKINFEIILSSYNSHLYECTKTISKLFDLIFLHNKNHRSYIQPFAEVRVIFLPRIF